MIGLNYIETDTMRMYINKEKKLERIWMPKAQGTLFPISQIPTDKLHLPSFAWLDHLRPKSKEDVFKWKGKTDSEKLRVIERQKAPVQRFESENKPKETTQQNTNKTSRRKYVSISMNWFKQAKPRGFEHRYLYYNERKEYIDKLKEKIIKWKAR